MKKLINHPERYVDEVLDGLVMAHKSLARIGTGGRVIRRSKPNIAGKVGIVSGGGSGHLPLFCGYVGDGLLDACSVGNVFEGPNMASCQEAIETANEGAGVLCLYGNYGGDRMNFDMASEMVELDGISVRTVLGTDDIAGAPPAEAHKRRGVAGIVFAYKAAGACASAGGTLDEVAELAQRTVARTKTIGAATSPCIIPGSKAPVFQIGDDEIEMGMGIHGEPGIWRAARPPADVLVDEMIERLLAEAPDDSNGRVAVLVNGFGSTPLEELFLMYRRAAERLAQEKFEISSQMVGEYVTSMEMAGLSISLCFLDEEIERQLAAPATCPFWTVGAK
ncbi:dihydroxyacetone kinase subunit DhaK [Devosia sp. YIM 151766]|uniref:dihydroxyacetone kinase subunit DhaK n=1 Tax=Devosia sp. YIM 151766 TaxID=3017325 RepID=UPI00255C2D7E|nr:dihydroxyacetone kinase subunit DhaK [Devosia sp. YIM 151766]WIY52739.1 dihydroxyacetone kinase subunit DhaK [Devosia sp. YIM 151766]